MGRARGSGWLGFGIGAAIAMEAAAGWCSGSPVEWEAPAGCPSREAFLERVQATAKSRFFDDTDVRARVHVEPEGDRWSARVVLSTADAGAERTFEGASCAAIADAAALIVGLALVAAPGTSSPGSTASAPVTGTPAAPASTASAPIASTNPAPAPTPPPRETTNALDVASRPTMAALTASTPRDAVSSRALTGGPSFRASAAADFGALPAAGPGATVGASWRLGLFEASLDGAAFAGERGTVAGSTSGASVALMSASASACLAVPVRDRVVMVPCAGLALERLTADGFGAANAFAPLHQLVVLPAALAEVGVEWSPVRRLGIRAAARVLAPWSRPTFVTRGPGSGSVYRPAFAAAEPSVGLVLYLDK